MYVSAGLVCRYTNRLFQFDSSVVDYVHKRKFPIIGPAVTWALRTATVGVLVGVYQFNTNDIGASSVASITIRFLIIYVGLTELIAKVWAA